jgi:predicted alpha/beta-fold hydrolase
MQMMFFFTLGRRRAFTFVRKRCVLRDGGVCAVDFAERHDAERADAPLVVICHGLAGSSENPAIVEMCNTCVARGWRAAVYIRRGHDGLTVESGSKPFPQHADTDDMDDVTQWLCAQFPTAPKILMGFSAGANVVVKYIGERGARVADIYTCSLSICNAFDIDVATKRRVIADFLVLRFLRKLVRHNAAFIPLSATDVGCVLRSKSVREFDAKLIVPLYGYEDVSDYYRQHSSNAWVSCAHIPLLCIGSRDDPFLCQKELHAIPVTAARVNSNVIAVTTARGGHLAWLEDVGRSWLPDVVATYISCFL